MAETPKQIAVRWFEEVWNQGSEAAIDELFSPAGKSHGFPEADSVLVGPEAFKEVHRSFRGAFPDLHVVIEEILAEGDHVALRWKVTMTHLGDHLGPPATGNKVTLSGSGFMIIGKDQILEGRNYINMQHLFKQLEAIPTS
jgi:steroid delta-isomerase-like uncharacterized protein